MLDEYLEAKAAVDTFDLSAEAYAIGWPAAEKKLKDLQQKRDDSASTVIFIPVDSGMLYLPKT